MKKLLLKKSLCTFISAFALSFSLNAFAESEKVERLKIAAVQFPVDGQSDIDQFLGKFESYVSQAKKKDADLVIFPELIAFDTWHKISVKKLSEKDKSRLIAEKLSPLFFEKVIKLSKAYNISIMAGSAPRIVGKEIYNTAIIAFPDGKSLMQDKVHLTYWEQKMGWKGGDLLKVFNAPWGKTSILICYDSEFPSNSEMLVKEKPELLLIPSMTEDENGLFRVRWSSQARAVEHHAYAVITGTVADISKDWPNYGQAIFITPRDKGFPGIKAIGKLNQAEILYSELDMSKLRKSRENVHLYPAKDEMKNRSIKVIGDLYAN